jgi:hypothetical protein
MLQILVQRVTRANTASRLNKAVQKVVQGDASSQTCRFWLFYGSPSDWGEIPPRVQIFPSCKCNFSAQIGWNKHQSQEYWRKLCRVSNWTSSWTWCPGANRSSDKLWVTMRMWMTLLFHALPTDRFGICWDQTAFTSSGLQGKVLGLKASCTDRNFWAVVTFSATKQTEPSTEQRKNCGPYAAGLPRKAGPMVSHNLKSRRQSESGDKIIKLPPTYGQQLAAGRRIGSWIIKYWKETCPSLEMAAIAMPDGVSNLCLRPPCGQICDATLPA